MNAQNKRARELMNTFLDWYNNDDFKPTTTWGYLLYHSGLIISILYYKDFQFCILKGDLWCALFYFAVMVFGFLYWRHRMKTQ